MDQSLEHFFALAIVIKHQSFNPYFSGSVTGTVGSSTFWKYVRSFNPYFSGSVTGTYKCMLKKFVPVSFNPYFSGSVTGTALTGDQAETFTKFQSLF